MSNSSRKSPWTTGDPQFPIRLIPSGDDTDEKRDELNAETLREIDGLEAEIENYARLIADASDPELQRAYAETCREIKRQIARLWIDVGADLIARLQKWNRLCPERYWKLVERDEKSGDIRCYHFSTRDTRKEIERTRHHNRSTQVLLLKETEKPPPDFDSGERYTVKWNITATNPESGETRTQTVEAASLSDAWRTVKASGYVSNGRVTIGGIDGEFPEPWSGFQIIGINPRTRRRKRFGTYARDYGDAIRRFRHRGIKVVKWLFSE